LIALDWLALEFGVVTEHLKRTMLDPPTNGSKRAPFPLQTYDSDGHFLLPAELAVAWVKDLLPRHKVWSSLDGRARDLATAIQGSVRTCAVSECYGENPAAVATCRCIATWQDVSRAHQEYLDNAKPITLEPDHV